MIYLDNAATTPLDGEVLEAMLPFLKDNFGNAQSQHAYGRNAANALQTARDQTAALLGCKPEEVYFTSGGTEANNAALKGFCFNYLKSNPARSGHLIVSAIEHPSVIESAKQMLALGFEVTFIKPDENGVVSPRTVEKHIKENTVFCAVMAANNETGVIQPVREIGAICRDRGVFFYSDCVQLAGAHKITADFCNGLAISAHKFYGPKGAGALVIKNGAKIAGLISGGMQERGLRGGTVNTANAVGLAKAYSIACKNAEKNSKNTAVLRDRLLTRILSEIPSAIRNGGGEILPAHLNVSFLGCRGENLLSALDLKGVAVSTGSACSAGAGNPSQVLTSMGLDAARVNSAVRFSFGKYNTLEQVDEAFEYLKQAVAKIRASK